MPFPLKFSITAIFCKWHSSTTLLAIQNATTFSSDLITKLIERFCKTLRKVFFDQGVIFEATSIL